MSGGDAVSSLLVGASASCAAGSPSTTSRSLDLVRSVAQAASGDTAALAASSGGVDVLLGLQPSSFAWCVTRVPHMSAPCSRPLSHSSFCACAHWVV